MTIIVSDKVTKKFFKIIQKHLYFNNGGPALHFRNFTVHLQIFNHKAVHAMIKSMTGYGKAETAVAGKKITVEIRSLNSKQLDLSVKVPGLYRSLEYEIRNCVAKVMQRGKVDVFISYETDAVSGSAAGFLQISCLPESSVMVVSLRLIELSKHGRNVLI